MSFTNEELQAMQAIFCHLEPRTLASIQHFSPEKKERTGCMFGVPNKYGKYTHVFQYFSNFSENRLKLLYKRKKEIPYPLHIVALNEKRVCVGWKWEKK